MDVVIPLGRSTASNYFELRYCLRSLERFFPDIDNVFIIGEKPSWIDRVFHFPEHDQKEQSAKERNIFRKLMKAVQSKLVSDDFLYVNDDHFLMAPWTEEYHFKGSLSDVGYSLQSSSLHRRTLANTLAYLGGGNNFGTHCPITFNKQKFLDTVGLAPWHIEHGYEIRSLYCNLNRIEGVFHPDLKIATPLNLISIVDAVFYRRYFSTDDKAINEHMIYFLEKHFPDKSIYERD